MKVDPKDRTLLLRMAGNIAGGLASEPSWNINAVSHHAAKIAVETMQEVDRLIAEGSEETNDR